MLCVKVCFYFVVTFITRSLSVVAALFVHFSHFLMTTLSRTWPKGFPFMCRENYEFEWQESCAERTNESRFPPSCPSPASLLLGHFFFLFVFFSNVLSRTGGVVSVLSQCKRLWKTNEMTGRRKTSKGDFYLFIVSLKESGLGEGEGGVRDESNHLSMLCYS